MRHQAPAFKPFLTKSLVLHGAVVILICFALYQVNKEIQEQELAFIEQIKEEEEKLKQQEEEAAEELMQEELAAQVADEFEQILEEELDLESAEQLQEQLQQQLEEWVDQAAQEQPLHEMTSEQLAELSEQLRNQSMESLQKQLQDMKEDMLLSMVRDKIENEIAPDIKRNIEQELKNNTGKNLKDALEKKAKEENKERLEDLQKELNEAKQELKELSKKQHQEVKDAASKDKTEAAQKAQDEVKQELSEIEKKISDTLEKVAKVSERAETDSLKKNLEETHKEIDESKKALDAEDKKQQQKEAQDVAKKIEQASKSIDQINKQLSQETRSRDMSDIDKQAIAEILPEVEQQAREEVTKAVTEKSVPLAAEKLNKALEQQLEELQMNSDEFKKKLEQEIHEALKKDLSEQQANTEVAQMRTADAIERRSSEDIKQARDEIQKALDKMEAVKEKQDSLQKETIRETASKDAQAEQQIKQEIKDARKDAEKALDEANKVSLKAEGHIKSARKDVESTKAEMKAQEASDFVKLEIVDEAKKKMNEVSSELEKKIAKLKHVDAGLAKEQEALEKIEQVSKDLQELLGQETSKKLKQEMKKTAEEQVSELAKADVKNATEKTRIDGKLEGIEQLEAMQELGELMAEAGESGRSMDMTGDLMGEMESGVLGSGNGMMGPGSGPGNGSPFPYIGGYGFFNRKLYEDFSKDMRERLNPKRAYEEQEEQEGLASTAEAREGESAASMVILKNEDTSKVEKAETTIKDRKVPEPDFKSIAFGAAAYAIDPITIDGDLTDWGELKHPQQHKYELKGTEIAGPKVYMRWSPKGLYFCYTVKDDSGINNHGPNMWQTDGMELFIDVRNWRKDDMLNSPTAQQIFFMPFGYQGNQAISFGESGRGHRGLKSFVAYPDDKGLRGKSAAKIIPGGYQVECFIKRSGLAQPVLAPGMYLAINHSVNLGNKYETQWSAPKSVHTWNNPDTWGDVLLLGSDARVSFKHFELHDQGIDAVLPGDPVRVEITDPDMNLYDVKHDRIMATVKADGSQTPLLLVLKETKANSGVFAASFSTQAYFMPPKENTLNIRGGKNIILSYTDARAGYGEKNRKVTAHLPVAWPVTKLGK